MKRITYQKLRAYFNYEDTRWRIQKKIRYILRKKHNGDLKNSQFTIISNNCWGGVVYEYYNLMKQSPTVGLFFMAEDYVEFCRNISYYVTADLRFIDPKQSKHYENIKGLNAFGKYPIGKIDDIEIMFLHYHSPQEALEKWKRRCERIIWDKMIFKFSDQNGCNEKDAEEFLNLPYKNKLFFSVHDEWELKNKSGYYLIRQRSKGESIKGSYEPMGKNRYFNLTQMINDL